MTWQQRPLNKRLSLETCFYLLYSSDAMSFRFTDTGVYSQFESIAIFFSPPQSLAFSNGVFCPQFHPTWNINALACNLQYDNMNYSQRRRCQFGQRYSSVFGALFFSPIFHVIAFIALFTRIHCFYLNISDVLNAGKYKSNLLT